MHLQGRDFVKSIFGCKHQIGRNSHQDIQNCPNHREQPAWWSQNGLVYQREGVHTILCQKRRQAADSKWNGNTSNRLFH